MFLSDTTRFILRDQFLKQNEIEAFKPLVVVWIPILLYLYLIINKFYCKSIIF